MGLADVVAGHKPRRIEVRLCPDQDLAEQLRQAREQLVELRKASQSLSSVDVDNARRRLADLQAAADDVSVTFVLEGIGRARWRALQDKHQPTKQQREQFRQQGVILDHNPDTFPVAAIAASLVDPVADSPEETRRLVRQMWDEWNFGECERLWRACLDANVGADDLPKSLTVFGQTPSSGQKSDSPQGQGSPGPSSTDGGSLAE